MGGTAPKIFEQILQAPPPSRPDGVGGHSKTTRNLIVRRDFRSSKQVRDEFPTPRSETRNRLPNRLTAFEEFRFRLRVLHRVETVVQGRTTVLSSPLRHPPGLPLGGDHEPT